jgi:hypothetical protein
VHSNNLLVAWCHEYVDMFRDMKKSGSIGQRLKHLWKPPEWERESSE